MDTARSSLTWTVMSNWTPSCSAKQTEALNSAAAAVNTSANMEEHAAWRNRGNFSHRSSAICSPANRPVPQAHPLLQHLKVSLMKAVWQMCCQAQHLTHAPGAAHRVHGSTDQPLPASPAPTCTASSCSSTPMLHTDKCNSTTVLWGLV